MLQVKEKKEEEEEEPHKEEKEKETEDKVDDEEICDRDINVIGLIHFCFLVHGHRGFSNDLSYLQTVLNELAQSKTQALNRKISTECSLNISDSQDKPKSKQYNRHSFIVHNVTCNEGRTSDGIKAGGERLAKEIVSVIRSRVQEKRSILQSLSSGKTEMTSGRLMDVTLSVIGNSLGGLYSRYAIAHLTSNQGEKNKDGENSDDDKTSSKKNRFFVTLKEENIRIYFNIFCTTATPHLGVASHTYIPLPRILELFVARWYGQTGRDVFRCNDMMKEMSPFHSKFRLPLRSFRKRIAYANAYHTDFPVSTGTGAFLNEQSDYPHHFEEVRDNSKSDGLESKHEVNNAMIVATLYTSPSYEEEYISNQKGTNVNMEMLNMSKSLDSLGWKKVFVDVRSQIRIFIPIPGLRWLLRRRRVNDLPGDEDAMKKKSHLQIQRQTNKKEKKFNLTSKDVLNAFASYFPDGDDEIAKVRWPLGHNMICAFSRSRISTIINRGGRPIMDKVAKEMVDDILKWEEDLEEEKNVFLSHI